MQELTFERQKCDAELGMQKEKMDTEHAMAREKMTNEKDIEFVRAGAEGKETESPSMGLTAVLGQIAQAFVQMSQMNQAMMVQHEQSMQAMMQMTQREKHISGTLPSGGHFSATVQ